MSSQDHLLQCKGFHAEAHVELMKGTSEELPSTKDPATSGMINVDKITIDDLADSLDSTMYRVEVLQLDPTHRKTTATHIGPAPPRDTTYGNHADSTSTASFTATPIPQLRRKVTSSSQLSLNEQMARASKTWVRDSQGRTVHGQGNRNKKTPQISLGRIMAGGTSPTAVPFRLPMASSAGGLATTTVDAAISTGMSAVTEDRVRDRQRFQQRPSSHAQESLPC